MRSEIPDSPVVMMSGRAGLSDAVEIRQGRAAETLAALPGPFDFVFLDADRPSYRAYLELIVPKALKKVPGLPGTGVFVFARTDEAL